jgi:hypothetical protein
VYSVLGVTRTLVRIAIAGVACALLLLLAGTLLERTLLGGAPADARLRVEQEVRDLFAVRSQRLKESARRATPIDIVRRALDDDIAATRALFVAARATLPTDSDEDAAVTIYDADRKPLAWAGRPSELRFETLSGGESWFIFEGGLGLRLVYVAPLISGTTRLGTVATEVGLPSAGDTRPRASSLGPADAFWLPTRLADVRLVPQLFADSRTRPSNDTFDVLAPNGQRLVTATVSDEDLAAGRDRWGDATRSLALIAIAITVLLMAAPLLDWRNRTRRAGQYFTAVLVVTVLIVIGRVLLRVASPADWSNADVFSGAAYASPLFWSFLASPFDFLADALAIAGIVAVTFFALETWRLYRWTRRRPVEDHLLLFVAVQIVAGLLMAVLLLGHQALIRDTIAHATLDLLHFSLHPWNNARVALQLGLVLAHTSVAALALLILRAATMAWRLPRSSWALRIVLLATWLGPLAAWQIADQQLDPRQLALLGTAIVIVAAASSLTRFEARYRRGSQAFRLMLLTLALIVPTLAFYTLVVVSRGGWHRLNSAKPV